MKSKVPADKRRGPPARPAVNAPRIVKKGESATAQQRKCGPGAVEKRGRGG
jgi:hypothetical protein